MKEVCEHLKESNICNIVICGIHSPIDSASDQERKCKEMILDELGLVSVVCSADSKYHVHECTASMAQ